ncbi:MAG: tail fiber domain-containing protein [Acidobacteria bacterium]|nr:tail fiber domain-containing protein [Acidobacteriota bacterium]
MRRPSRLVLAFAAMLVPAVPATAQSLGTFTWQLTPYCNRVVAEVTQNGPHFEIDGYDDRCGAAQRAPLSGIATPNSDGTIGFGLTIVTLGGTAVHVDARMSLSALSGPWFDSAGNGGTFVFGGPGGGSPRPAAGLSTTTLAVSGAGAVGGTLTAGNVTTAGTVSAQHGVFSGDTSARFGSFSGGLGVDGFVSVAAPAPRITMIGAGASGPSLEFLRSGGTVAAPTAAGPSMSILAKGYTGASFETGARIDVLGSGTWSPASHGAGLYFGTTQQGTTSNVTRMIVQHDGNVAIGNVGVTGGDRLHVYGDIRVGSSQSDLGCLKNALGTQLAGACSSDLRLKRDVSSFEPALDRVSRLRPVHFSWRTDAFPARGFGAARTYGLIAQEVETVLPELVTTGEDGFKRVDYSQLPLLAIQAIGELKRDNDALRAELTTLRVLILSSRDGHAPHEVRR